MADKELQRKKNELALQLAEIKARIQRYTLDPRLREDKGTVDDQLRRQADQAWNEWLVVWGQFQGVGDSPTWERLQQVEGELLRVERRVDLIQRELITGEGFRAGIKTVFWLAGALLALVVFYLLVHGVHSLDFSTFEPFPEWGPLKYVEVAFWSSFGVLCSLLYLATRYLTRRDFDKWYQTWYLSTALRAPFFAIILMMVVLEFVEWYGEGTWIESYVLEEGNKFYFIVFMSFCLGLEDTSSIIRNLSSGVLQFVSNAVARLVDKLGSAFQASPSGK